MNKTQLKSLGVRLPSSKRKGPNPYRDPVQYRPNLPAGLSEKLNLPKLDLLKDPRTKK